MKQGLKPIGFIDRYLYLLILDFESALCVFLKKKSNMYNTVTYLATGIRAPSFPLVLWLMRIGFFRFHKQSLYINKLKIYPHKNPEITKIIDVLFSRLFLYFLEFSD